MEDKIRLGVSACLLGEKVRYDGSHQLNHYLTRVLGEYIEYVPVCPEVELGLPTPRESLRLIKGEGGQSRLVYSRSGGDITAEMEAWAKKRALELEKEQLDGFVFKSKSPSSGMERVRLYDRNGVPSKTGVGVFARIFMEQFPLLPVEEEGRLNDPKLRENFITCIFTMRRWRQMLPQASLGKLVDFHSRHKLLMLAHSETIYRQMGKLVAAGKDYPLAELLDLYWSLLMKGLRMKTTRAKHGNVLQHVFGYFKRELDPAEKQEVLGLIDDFRHGLVPLIVPVTLLNHFVRKYQQAYLGQQVYLNPHPKELKLLNHV